ncbi:hypothetical protein HK098_001273 [Nowakowskiella sp. JEL0407]|nr:hypothetical protein HK098_001273 [Nowakowskiella sp. JEL0407]
MPGGEYVNSFISKFGADIMPRGFTYIPTEFSGKVLGTERESQTLVVASHIATYLRMCVKKILGFTCSCGIAKNKMLAKLASNVNKPDDQTTVSANEREVLEFVGNHGVGSIPGIGFASRKILMQKLNPQQRTVPENTVGEPDPFLRMNESALDLPDADNLLPTPTIVAEDVWYYNVNVSNILRQCTALNFKEWFGDEHGLRYWDLMHGIDGSKVVQSTLPSNISVEDSFGKCETFEDLEHHLRNLARLLIERLREEEFEWDRPFIDAETIPRWILGYKAGKEYFGLSNNSDNSKIKQKYGKNAPASNKANQFNVKGNWRRHAKSLRLTVRRRDPSDKAVMGARESRSTVMPLEVYNTTKAISELVNILVSPLYPILRSLLGSSQPEALNLINIGAADFIQGPPMKTITSFFAAKPKQKECSEKTVISEREKLPSQDEKDSLPENVSLEVWNELPKHIQTELRVANAISSQSNNFGNTRVTGGKRTRDEPRQRNTKSKKTSANVKKADASAYFKKSFQS